MTRRLLASSLAACLFATPALAAPADYGPADGWTAARERLEAERRDPVTAAVLNGLVPGVGTAYAGDVAKGSLQAAGALGVLGAAFLLSTLVRAVTPTPELALIVAIAPYPAYLGYAVTDGYASTAMRNQRIDYQQAQLMPMSFNLQVARF